MQGTPDRVCTPHGRTTSYPAMRRALLSVCVAGCTLGSGSRPGAPVQPRQDVMPPSVLDHQDPGADTSHNPELTRSSHEVTLGGLIGDLFSWHTRAPSVGSPAETSHYYHGCHCATQGSSDPPVLAIAMGLVMLRRRRKHRANSRTRARFLFA